MKPYRMTALLVGVLFVVGSVAGVLSQVVTAPVFGAADFPANVAREADSLVIGALLVLTMAFSLAMIPAVLFPLFRQYDEVLAVGAVVFRGILEHVGSFVTVLSWFGLIVLSQWPGSATGAEAEMLENLSGLMLKVTDIMGMVAAIAFSLGALIIYALFYRARLIPRWISVWALVGAVLYIVAQVWGMFEPQQLPLTLEHGIGMLMIPTAIQEMFMAGWLVVKGFSPTAQIPAPSTGGRGLAAPAH